MNTQAVQQKLISLGYDLGPAGADGVMGRRTLAAIKKFQADAGLDIKFPGTVGPKTIVALGLGNPAQAQKQFADATPPWMAELLRRVGLHEKRDNKKLRDWLKSDGNTLGDPAVLPWCGDAIETPIALTLPDEPLPDNPYWALNWSKFGVPCYIVARGAIAAFKRPGGGHVGMIAGHEAGYYHVLGGNQSNAISIVRIEKGRLQGELRWPRTYPLPLASLPHSTINATVSHNEA